MTINSANDSYLADSSHPDRVLIAEINGEVVFSYLTNDRDNFLDAIHADFLLFDGREYADDIIEAVEVFEVYEQLVEVPTLEDMPF